MARRKKKGDGGGGDPAWLITFSDLMTLLLTFFVLLLSMSVIDERAKLVVLGSVTRTFDAQERLFNPTSKRDKNTVKEPGRMDDLSEDDMMPLRDMVRDDVDKDIDFRENKYVQIFSINGDVLFQSGTFQLSPKGIELLDRLIPILQRMEYPLLVAGHTSDARDEAENSYRVDKTPGAIPDTWALSYQRSMAVYRHLVKRSIEPRKLTLEAFGEFAPWYSNNTPEGRRGNRRVDLVLDKRNLEWIRRVEQLQKDNPEVKPHIYNGFQFDLSLPGESAPRRNY